MFPLTFFQPKPLQPQRRQRGVLQRAEECPERQDRGRHLRLLRHVAVHHVGEEDREPPPQSKARCRVAALLPLERPWI